ncbi:hypothetical protein FQN54_000226 [Arachnomyces sp. PD_36]|nr:hypothetical protein FQN54_000226 [Arachnomyces sp. PD_36]
MAPAAEAEGSEDVNDFLLRIRELGDKRDKEDEERTRKLEEEILKGRKERQARRAERARSISPTKDSPLSNVAALTSSTSQQSIEPPVDLFPSSQPTEQSTPQEDSPNLEKEKEYQPQQRVSGHNMDPGTPKSTRPLSMGFKSPPSNSTSPSRSGALSWQRRPTLDETDDKSARTTSLHASDIDATRKETPPVAEPVSEPTQDEEAESSRERIAKSLGSKDPAWFRQTADRGIGSPAYRKNQDDTMSDVSSVTGSMRLPGMSRESTTEPEKAATTYDHGSERSRSPSRASSTYGSSLGNRYSSISSVSTSGGAGGIAPISTSHRLDSRNIEPLTPTAGDTQSGDRYAMSPSQGRLSPERSSSPTKGLGGFVQSAMMKRSDSQSKRWSAQAGPGLSRGNSIASNRSGFGSNATWDMKASAPVREGSPLASSRPGSSHSEATVIHNHGKEKEPAGATPSGNDQSSNDGFVKPPLPSQESFDTLRNRDRKHSEVDVPTSPSKTMDPKRWSPTKASWLESALNRPESPKPKPQAPQQPSWMKDINRTRQQKASVDLGKTPQFKEVTPVGLMRSPPPGTGFKKPGSISERAGAFASISSKTTELENIPPSKNETPVDTSDVLKDPPVLKPAFSPPPESDTDVTKSPSPDGSLRTISPTRDQPDLESISSKPKPQPPTSSVKDFRSNLRPRGNTGQSVSKDEPEFKNVFGKLKKTETKNYKAPDELKDNILRGKAALNVTGGPKPTKRVDEFKESILKQKEAMKAGGGSIRGPDAQKERPPSASPVPEAISKRGNLAKSDSILSGTSTDDMSTLDSYRPKDLSKDAMEPSVSGSDDLTPTTSQEAKFKTVSETIPAQRDPGTPTPVGRSQSDESETRLSEKLEQTRLTDRVADETRAKPATNDPEPSRLVSNKPASKGKLADRLNPALAGILSRGPPAMNEEDSNKPTKVEATSSASGETKQSSDAPLTHMTKARARGPKRRAPKASAANASSPASKPSSPQPLSQKPSSNAIELPKASTPVSSRDPSPEKPSISLNEPSGTPTPTKPIDTRVKPTISAKSPELRKFSPNPPSPQVARNEDTQPKQRGFPLPSRDGEPTIERSMSDGLEKTSDHGLSPNNRPAPPPKSASFSSVSSSATAKENAPQPPPKPHMLDNTGLSPRLQKRINTGLTSPAGAADAKPKSPINKSLPSPPKNLPESPPVPEKNPDIARHSLASRIPETSEATRTFAEFFNNPPNANEKANIDPQTILPAMKGFPKIKTVRKQVWEINGDGKRQDLPPNQEYIFFEENMYLCVHYFEMEAGAKNAQVHLWCGDGVGEASLEDAQLFAKKMAREHSCKLELLKQGKETAIFIQALGGIIITRRGASKRSNPQYMLCGRSHLGQIAFDEVDLDPRNLCSKYPYIVSGRSGKVYLWKGVGSNADEIGCARLIGMDLGDIEEVAEGEEPKSFFEAFPDSKDASSIQSLEHWKLKPNQKFCCRLFRVDHELGQRGLFGSWGRRGPGSPVSNPNDTVQEIMPFCQKDIEPGSIYVLDAFFEIYVIVGDRANSKSPEMASALILSQEYGILAASLQDRPSIPTTSVALYGIPDECRSVFRKYEAPRLDNSGKPIKVFPLNAAIEAIRS